jgi:SAM-dependent methyltransferase
MPSMSAVTKGSPLVRFLITRFDFIIRFLYCKLRFYKIFDFFLPRLYSSNYESLNSYFDIIAGALKKNKFTIEGKRILELGPGNSYINAYNFLRNGAKEVILIDKFPRYADSERQKSYIRNEIDYFKSKHRVKKFDYVDETTCCLNENCITFIGGDLCECALDRKVDFIYSIAVLHHIKGLDRYIRRMSELLNPGGMMYHVIDLKDKFHFFGNPFLFYKYSDFTWDRLLTDEAVTYTNRVRYGEYLDMFAASGLVLVWENTISHDIPKMRINSKFAGRNDLSIGDAHFLVRKKK